jgi:tetratricopeptide (TPR) repeat protein
MGGSPGDSAGALISYKRALAILEDVSPRTDDTRKAMVDVYSKLGSVERNTGATAEGLESYRKAQAVAEELLATSPSRHELQRLAGVFTQSSRTLAAMGDLEGSLASTNRALSILNRLNESGASTDDEVQHELALAYTSLSVQLPRVGRLKDGLENARKAVQIREGLVQRQPNDLRFLRNLMLAWQHLGDTLGGPTQPNLGDHKAAIRAYQKMLGIASSLRTRDPGDKRLDQDLALALQRLGIAQTADGRLPEGLDNLKHALEMETAAMESDQRNVFLKRNTALTLTQIARIEEKGGDHVAALSHGGRAVEISQALIRQDPGNREAQAEFLESARVYSLMAARSGNKQTAMEFASQLDPVSRQLAKGSSDWTQVVQPAISQAYLGDIQTALGNGPGAAQFYKESAHTFQDLKAAGRLDAFYNPVVARVAALASPAR